jgi:hypothetical protein
MSRGNSPPKSPKGGPRWAPALWTPGYLAVLLMWRSSAAPLVSSFSSLWDTLLLFELFVCPLWDRPGIEQQAQHVPSRKKTLILLVAKLEFYEMILTMMMIKIMDKFFIGFA